ncbi:MAG: anaerobic ribonucleoside-triphosphate reductase activating protein [Spirochaetota bacterium]
MGSLDRLGLLKTSLADYPGEVAAVLFTAGCNLRCPYCHNPELVHGQHPADFLSRDEVEAFLRKRANVLTGVCITGGEPLLHDGLAGLVDFIHGLGLKVKIDTNGMLPDRIAPLEADYLALDLKLAPERYAESLAAPASAGERIERAVLEVRRHPAPAEFRTTVVPGLVHRSDAERIVSMLRPGDRYVLAAFHPGTTLDPIFEAVAAPPLKLLEEYAELARAQGAECRIRAPRETSGSA